MAADETYFTKTYSKLKTYLLEKGYREDCILEPQMHGNLTMTVRIGNYDLKGLNEIYFIIEEGNRDRIEEMKVALMQAEIIAPNRENALRETDIIVSKNVNYYAVTDTVNGLKFTVIINKGIKTVRTFYDRVILQSEAAEDEQFFYRGHSDAMNHFLKPGIYRPLPGRTELAVQKEEILYKEAVRRCPEDFDRCRSAFEHLVKMQHYRVPTRLLDITTNPLVALYFACQDDEKKEADGEVYAFRVKKSEIKYFDSDAVSVVANLAKRPITFSPDDDMDYLLHEIRYEKPYFLDLIDREDLGRVFCVLPKLNNPRIIRQNGAFFLFGIKDQKQEQAEFKVPFRRYTISAAGKKKILSDLARLGIDESTLFPELDMVADYLKQFGI